jgi:hypothetical protein
MKKLKFIFVMLIVIVTTIATATEKSKLFIIPLEANKAIISLRNETPTCYKMQINSETGQTVFKNESNTKVSKYQKVFNFSDLKHGNYILSFKVNNTIIYRKFDINYTNINVGNTQISYDPCFTIKNDFLKISYLNFQKEKLTLYFYNNGELVFKSKLGDEFTINAGYDLSKLEKGDYNVVLSGNKSQYSYSIVK